MSHSLLYITLLDLAHKQLREKKGFTINTINTALYFNLVEQICKQKDATSIPFLLGQFTDKEEYYPILKQLKEYIEKYYFNEHLSELLQHFNILVRNAPTWAGVFAFEFFKHPLYREKVNDLLLCNSCSPKKIIDSLYQGLISYEASIYNIRKRLKNHKGYEI